MLPVIFNLDTASSRGRFSVSFINHFLPRIAVLMVYLTKRNLAVFFLAVLAAGLFSPATGYADTKRSGFYAGALSVAAETIAETKAREALEAEEAKDALKNKDGAE